MGVEGDCDLEASCKVELDKLIASRFILFFKDKAQRWKKYLNQSLGFFHQVGNRVGVHLDYSLLQQFLGHDFDFSKVTVLSGELIEVPPESGLNVQIANRLFLIFALMLGSDRVRGHGLELEVRGEPKNRYPDLTIIREEHIQQLSKRNTIRLSMAPSLLVIEVVSPEDIQKERDYIAKRMQYQECGIPEYWIVDPQTQTIVVLELRNNSYTEVGNFSNDNLLRSPEFKELNLKVSEVFDRG